MDLCALIEFKNELIFVLLENCLIRTHNRTLYSKKNLWYFRLRKSKMHHPISRSWIKMEAELLSG